MNASLPSSEAAEKEAADKIIIEKIRARLKPKAFGQREASQTSLQDTAAPSRSAISKKRVLFGLTAIIFMILMGLVIRTSVDNTKKYYLNPAAGAVELWKGTFSPGGKKRILIMPGVQIPQKIKEVYAREEVYPMAFNFYVSKADALMEVPGMPDFVGIKSYLNRALSFATTEQLSQSARVRINQIDRMILFYKADVAATKGTRIGFETALKHLDQAAELNPDEIETELIKKKKASIRELLNTHKETTK